MDLCREGEGGFIYTLIPRGPGPLCSILLPTRNRPDHLVLAIDSAYSLAKDKGNVEFVLKIDDDDAKTIEVVERLEKLPGLQIKKIVSPRGRGYFDMHHWVNGLAKISTGDWLFLFNDDARFVTQDWDNILMHVGTAMPWLGIQDVCLIMAQTIGRPFAHEFFFLRRKTFEILGHISLSPHNDNWIYGVMDFMRVRLTAPIHIEHLSDKVEDDIRKASVEAYKTTILSLNSLPSKRLQVEDAIKLFDYLADFEANVVWRDKPERFSWCIWRGEDGINQTFFADGARKTFRFKYNDSKDTLLPEFCEVHGGKWATIVSYPIPEGEGELQLGKVAAK